MTFWNDRFKNHAVHQELDLVKKKIEPLLDSAEQPEVIDRLIRLKEVIIHTVNTFKIFDPMFVPILVLKEILDSLQTLNTNLDNFSQSKKIGHLNQANSQADSILTNLGYVPKIESELDLKLFMERTNTYLDQIGNSVRDLKEEVSDVDNKAGETREEILLDAESLKKNIEEQKSDIEAQKGRLDQAIATFQGQFSDAEALRNTQEAEAANKREVQFQQNLTALEKKQNDYIDKVNMTVDDKLIQWEQVLEKEIEEKKEQIENGIEDIKKQVEEAKKLVNLTGNISITGDYQKIANQEKFAANMLRLGALLLFTIGVGIAGYLIYLSSGEKFEWLQLLARMPFSLTVLVPAAICLSESHTHRRREEYNRRMELQLASINPYLALLDDEQRKGKIEELTNSFFGNFDIIQTKEKSNILERLMDEISDTRKELIKYITKIK